MDPEPKITDKETMVEDNKEDGDELDDDSSHQVGEYRSKRRTVAVVETNSPSSADSNSLTPVTARKVGVAPVTAVVVCQAEKCGVDLSEAKKYRRRHKVCEAHFKAQAVVVAGIQQRFCQQCSRFHKLSEFDDTKKSCRRRLAGHNERRRKSSSESQGEG